MAENFAPPRRTLLAKALARPLPRPRAGFDPPTRVLEPAGPPPIIRVIRPSPHLRLDAPRAVGYTSPEIRLSRQSTSISDRFRLVRRKAAQPATGSRLRDFSVPDSSDSLLKRHETLIKELRLAEQVQRSMLPRVLPKIDGLTFGASLRPSLHLSGDFYNVLRLDRNHIGFYLGDVMGHGPAAALLGVFSMQGLRTKRIEGTSYEILPPSQVLEGLSHDLIQAEFPESPFVTMVYGVLDTRDYKLTFSCGGHPPALLLRPGQPAARLESIGPLLGIFKSPFEQKEIWLERGDRVALYSDGVESVSWGRHGNGVDGLARCLSIRDGRSAQLVVDEAIESVAQAEGPNDDITLVLAELA